MNVFSDINGVLCVQMRSTDYNNPVELIHNYPTELRTIDFMRNFSISSLNELQITNQESYGVFEFCIKNSLCGPRWKVQLKDGGKTLSIETLKTPIPCPKVKAGIMTRYYSGEWQKYLKAKGWCTA